MISEIIRDYDVEARVDDLLISQYKNSPNLQEYIKSFTSPIQVIMPALADSIDSRSIDLASGHALDKIATTVGESRLIKGAAALGYFGFKAEPSAEGLSIGTFYSYGDKTTGDLRLTDIALRRLIRARIILNTRPLTVENCIEYYELLLGRALDLQVMNAPANSAAYFKLVFHERLSTSDKTLLNVRYAKPVGVWLDMEDEDGPIEIRSAA